jgi:tetratricopeptide (TPR) repeat protein
MITLRVFLSSPFLDMQEERDELVLRVFPRLRRWAEELGIHLAEIDLRWGIPEGMEALPTCLDEVDACRPLFLCFLGGVYGSIAGESKLTAELRERFPWMRPDDHGRLSYTELEIIHAVFREDIPEMESLFYFRNASYSAEIEERLSTLPLPETTLARIRCPVDKAQMERLKSRIRDAGLPVVEGYRSASEFGERVEQDLMPLIRKRAATARGGILWAARKGRLWAGRRETMESVSLLPLRFWTRSGFLRIFASRAAQGLVIGGQTGSGKSALAAAWIQTLQRNLGSVASIDGRRRTRSSNSSSIALKQLAPSILVLSADDCFGGELADTPLGWPRMAKRIIEFIRDNWAPDLACPDDSEPLKLLYALPKAFGRIPQSSRLLLVLDSPDTLRDRARNDSLSWLPTALPPSVWVVVTAGSEAESISRNRKWSLRVQDEVLDPLLLQEILVARLGEQGKRLAADPLAEALKVVSEFPTRWLVLVLEDLRPLGSYRKIPLRLKELVEAKRNQSLPRVLLEAIASQHGGEEGDLLWRTVSFLMQARNGLLEIELRQLLSKSDAPLPARDWSPLFLALREWLRPTSGLIDPGPELKLAWNLWLEGQSEEEKRRRERDSWIAVVDYFVGFCGPESKRALEQIPWLYRDSPALSRVLSNPVWLEPLWRERAGDVRLLWRKLGTGTLVSCIEEWNARYRDKYPLGWLALGTVAGELIPKSELALEAARHARKMGEESAFLLEARLLRQSGRHEESCELLARALDFESLLPPAVAAEARLDLAEAIQLNQPERSNELARKALEIANSHDDPGLMMRACEFIGRMLLQGSTPGEARPFFEELERIAGLVGAEVNRVLAQIGQGVALLKTKGRLVEAAKRLTGAVKLSEEIGDAPLLVEALANETEALLQLRQWANAVRNIHRQLTILNGIETIDDKQFAGLMARACFQQARTWRDSCTRTTEVIAAKIEEASTFARKAGRSDLEQQFTEWKACL